MRKGRDVLAPVGALTLVFLCVLAVAPAQAQDFDVLIVNGWVVDGTGNPGFRADVGIVGDRIEAIGRLGDRSAARTIDASGLHVVPGFVDLHSHATTALSASEEEGRHAHNLLTQGVTTVMGASDGTNAIWPLSEEIAGYLSGPGIALNVAPKVGHNSIRMAVMGDDFERPATPTEVREMQRLLREGMELGAWGLGAGLEGGSGRYSTTEELIELARVVAEYDGVYVAHQRSDQGGRLPGWMLPSDLETWPIASDVDWGADAIRETIRIARETGIRVVGSHVKASGRASWGRSELDVMLVREAREAGHQVYLDTYPYSIIGGGARPLIPRWAFEPAGEVSEGVEGGLRDQFRRNLEDPALRNRLERDMEYLIDISGGPERLIIIDHPDSSLRARRVGNVAAERGITPIELLVDFALTGYDLEDVPEGAWIRGEALHESDMERYMQQDFTATASDAGIVDVPGGYDRGPPSHPRYYGAFVRRISRYVNDRNTTTLAFAIRSATSLPAQIAGLTDRGLLRAGMMADVVVFDLERMQDRATTVHPKAHSSGIEYVLINGVLTLDGGTLTRELPGRVLLKSTSSTSQTSGG